MTAAEVPSTTLVVAHPGHELRVHHWLENVRPRAAHGYEELRSEVARALAAHGAEAFRYEVLSPVAYGLAFESVFALPPAYEAFGEARVRSGLYREVVRYGEHFSPLVTVLRNWALDHEKG